MTTDREFSAQQDVEETVTGSEEETIAFACRFASRLEPGSVVCLWGGLGTGKTHFVKGVAKHFGIDPDSVHSPTFTLIHEYEGGDLPLYHFDCYRLERVEEALEIGAEEYFYGEGVSIIEWPGKIEPIIPEHALFISMETEGPNRRKIKVEKLMK